MNQVEEKCKIRRASYGALEIECVCSNPGHHVSSDGNEIKTAEPAQRELIANNYAAAVIEAITRRWYYKMGRYLIKEIAGWYFAFGLAAANHDRYRRAAKRFYAAWCLDPEMKEAAEYYWQVRRTYEKDAEQSKRIT